MAIEHKDEGMGNNSVIIELSKKEAYEIVALLTAQLGDVSCPGRHHGACPYVATKNEDGRMRTITFVLAPYNKEKV